MVATYVVLHVGRVRVTLAAIGALYPADAAQMTDVVIQILPPFERFPALAAVQTAVRAYETANPEFLIARVPRVEDQVSAAQERLATLGTLEARLPAGLGPPWKREKRKGDI